jgi:hypothetical protein
MKLEPTTADFSDEQKRYLEGFMSGLQVGRVGRLAGRAAAPAGKADPEPIGPDAAGFKAQGRIIASGKKLADQEKFKREEHPFDAYSRLKEQALTNAPPTPADNFRWRYYGLFYVAPNQTSYMCRLRIPNGILKHWQFASVADLAERFGGGYSHITTRANIQIREIPPKHTVALIEGIQDVGLCSRGSGADNIRNVTGTPTAGIDPQELLDTREYAREWHYHILNDRSLYGLPRKFNVAFDGAGKIAVLEDTNDIAFSAVEVNDGFGVEPGVWFRLGLGGITGHRDFAKYGDIIVKPLDGMGGTSVFRLHPQDHNIGVVIETVTQYGKRTVMAQKFIPEIAKGDKRVLIIDGEPVPYSLARIPKQGETRGNLAAGGTGVAQPLSDRDLEIAGALGPELKAAGLLLVGLDVIGNYLTEVNVTSPTCMREIADQTGFNVAGMMIDALEKAVSGK